MNQGFDGLTARTAIPARHTPSLLEQGFPAPGKRSSGPVGVEPTADQYCAAIDAWIAGSIDYKTWSNIASSRHVIRHGCCIQHASLLVDLRIQGIEL